MFSIIYGLEGSDRDAFAENKIKSALEIGKTSWILVPEQFSMSTERSMIKKFGISAQSNIKVITFSRLCNLVLSYVGPLRTQYINEAGRQIIAARTIRALKGRLEKLAPNLNKNGFSSTIVDLVSEFKRYGVSPDALLCAAEDENPDFLAKIRDLSLITKTFNELLESHASDADDNISIILPKIKECNFLKGELFIMHFRSFTPIEYSAIGELMRLMDVCAVMCCDSVSSPSALFAPVAATCRTLTDIAESNDIKCLPSIKREAPFGDSELSHLCHNFFASRPVAYPHTPDSIKLYHVTNRYREVEAAADLILKLCRTEGRKFSDFLILARSTAEYNRIMPAIFESRGIDVFLDTRRSLLTKPLVVMLCEILDILAFGYSYDRVMTLARTGLCDVSDNDADMFENYLLATSPSHAMWEQDKWEYCPRGYDIDVINRTREAILKPVLNISSKLSGRKSAKEICNAILDYLKEDNTLGKTDQISRSFAERNMPYLSEEYRQVWNSVISIISQISVLMDDEDITYKDFAELFKNACSGISVGMTPRTQGSVIFSPIDLFRSSNTPVVIVLGMTDGVFPANHTSEGLLSDAERETLYKHGISLAPGVASKQNEEQLLIYSVLTAAKEKLYLFSPLASNDGKQLDVSPIVTKIQSKIFPCIVPYNPDADGDILHDAEGKHGSFEALCSLLADNGGGKDGLSSVARELYSLFASDNEFSSQLVQVERAMQTKEPEKIPRAAVEAIYGKTLSLSVSRLEKYNACAFSYFLSYGLFLSERDKSSIEPRGMGNVQHAALYDYFSAIKEKGIDYADITKEACYHDICELVKKEAMAESELLYESSAYYKYIVSRMQGIASRTAWEVIKFYRSSLFRPVGYEIRIGTNGPIPSITIQNANGDKIASVKGIIDRADAALIDGKTYISIVDYKSSQKTLDARLSAAGVNLQPLLYSDIVCKRMNASPAAMIYMQMTDPIISDSKLKFDTDAEIEKAVNSAIKLGGWLNNNASVISGYSCGGENSENYLPSGSSSLVEESELLSRIAAANKKIKESAIGIYEGNIKAEPYIDNGYNACEYCLFGGICNKRKVD